MCVQNLSVIHVKLNYLTTPVETKVQIFHCILCKIHGVPKNVTILSRYNSNIHEMILIIFITNVTESLCQKWELFLSSIGVTLDGQYCWDILLSQQMLDAIITLFITVLCFIKTVQSCIQHSPTAAV